MVCKKINFMYLQPNLDFLTLMANVMKKDHKIHPNNVKFSEREIGYDEK